MANPLKNEEEIYKSFRIGENRLDADIGAQVYNIILEDAVSIEFACAECKESKGEMPPPDAEGILVFSRDIEKIVDSVIVKVSRPARELLSHYAGTELCAINFIVGDYLDRLNPRPIPLGDLDKIIAHAQAMKKFLGNLLDKACEEWVKEKLYDHGVKHPSASGALPDGMIRTDLSGKLQYISPGFLWRLGYSYEEAMRMKHSDLVPSKWRVADEYILSEQVGKRGYSDEYIKEYARKNGGVIAVRVKSRFLKDKSGLPSQICTLLRPALSLEAPARKAKEEPGDIEKIIEEIGVGITVSDASGRFEIFNAKMQEITGYLPGEVNAGDFNALIYPDSKARRRALDGINEVIKEGGYRQTETVIRTKSGLMKTLFVATSLVQFKNRKMFLSAYHDITARKNAEEKLLITNLVLRLYERLISFTGIGIYKFTVDEGRLLFANQGFLDMLGFDGGPQDLIGRPLHTLIACVDKESALTSAPQQEEVRGLECSFKNLKGDNKWVVYNSFVSLDERTGKRIAEATIEDITLRKQSEAKIEHLASFPEMNPNPVLELDVSGKIIFSNKAAFRILQEMRLPKDPRLFLPKNIASLIKRIKDKKEMQFYEEVKVNERVFAESIYLMPKFKNARIYTIDISERKKIEEERERLSRKLIKTNRKLQDMAFKDSHTGLYNHRHLVASIEAEFARAKRLIQPLSVVMMDIDYFKSVNDVYGHQFGDMVLKQFAGKISKAVRSYDTVIRYGGEEFTVISPGTDKEGVLILAKRILNEVNSAFFGRAKNKIKLKLSLAVVSFPEDQNMFRGMDLICMADKILAKAKMEGGNKICSFQDICKKEGALSEENTIAVQMLKEKIGKLAQRLNQGMLEEILAFAKTMKLREQYGVEHAERCSGYAQETARLLGFSEKSIETIRCAAILHDLGKVGVSESILLKHARLTRLEYDEIKRHPQIGADIVKAIHSMPDLVPFVLHHHERWDGKGYPAGLKRHEIPQGARIISVVDAYQALSSDRPYRKAYPEEKTMDIIKRGAGSRFDSAVVKAFLHVLINNA